MFSEMPKRLQAEVKKFIAANNFAKAKSVFDQWKASQQK